MRLEEDHGSREHRVLMMLLRRFLEIAFLDGLERRGALQVSPGLLPEAEVFPWFWWIVKGCREERRRNRSWRYARVTQIQCSGRPRAVIALGRQRLSPSIPSIRGIAMHLAPLDQLLKSPGGVKLRCGSLWDCVYFWTR